MKTIESMITKYVSDGMTKQYVDNIKTTKDKWIDVDYQNIFNTILDFIYSL